MRDDLRRGCGDRLHPVTLALEGIGRQAQALALLAAVETGRVQCNTLTPQLADRCVQAGQFALRQVGQRGNRDSVQLRQLRLLACQRAQGGTRPHFQQHATRRFQQARQCRGKAHRPAQVLRPVIGAARGLVVQPVGVGSGHHRQRGRMACDGFHLQAERFHHRIHHRRMECVRSAQRPAGDALRFQLRLQRRQRFRRPRDHAGTRCILGSQRHACRKTCQHRVGTHS